MSSRSLPAPLVEEILQQLDAEAAILRQIDALSRDLTRGGLAGSLQTDRPAELTHALQAWAGVEVRRATVRRQVGQTWGCPPQQVRLSQARVTPASLSQEFHRRRRDVLHLAVQAGAALHTAQETLRGWQGLVNFVLGQALPSAGDPGRYAANGQRVAPAARYGIDMRS
jgi:hypothetical protein